MMTDEFVLVLTCRVLGTWAVLAGAGWLADAPHWAVEGALGRNLHRWRRSVWWRWSIFDLVHTTPGFAALGALQLVSGLWLLLAPGQPLLALLALCLAGLFQALRGAGDGADKMAMVVVCGSILQAVGLMLDQPLMNFAGVLWIGGQLTLAYATAGFSKLRHAAWRDGTAIRTSLSSQAYGCGWASRLVRRSGCAIMLAWAVIVPEVLFPGALLLPTEWLAGTLGLFLLLHLAIAVFMGLNAYPLAFAASYPSALMLGQWLRTVLGIT